MSGPGVSLLLCRLEPLENQNIFIRNMRGFALTRTWPLVKVKKSRVESQLGNKSCFRAISVFSKVAQLIAFSLLIRDLLHCKAAPQGSRAPASQKPASGDRM